MRYTLTYDDGSAFDIGSTLRVTRVDPVDPALVRAAMPHRLRMDVPGQGSLRTHGTGSRWAPEAEPADYARTEEGARYDLDAYMTRVAYWRRRRWGYGHVHAGGGAATNVEIAPVRRAPRAPAAWTPDPVAFARVLPTSTCPHSDGLPYQLEPYECARCQGHRLPGEKLHGRDCVCRACLDATRPPIPHDGRHGRSCGRCMTNAADARNALAREGRRRRIA